MAIVALIQKLHPVLNERRPNHLSDFSKQVYIRFFEVLVEESGHIIQKAPTFEDYQNASYEQQPDLVICAPFPEIGNLAPGFAELDRIRAAFPSAKIIIWSNRDEESLRKTCLEDYGVLAFYTGTLLDAPDDFADMILQYT